MDFRNDYRGCVAELAERYELSPDVANICVRQGMKQALEDAFKTEIEVSIKSGQARIFSFAADGRCREIPHEDLEPNILRHIMYSVRNELTTESDHQIHRLLTCHENTIIRGAISGHGSKGSVRAEVMLKAGDEFRTFTAVCSRRNIPHHERGTYNIGKSLWFYISTIKATRSKKTSRLEICLSRTTKTLPELLLRQFYIAKRGKDIGVECIRRMAGGFSQVKLDSYVPPEILRAVSDELGEAIRVVKPPRFSDDDRQAARAAAGCR